MAARRRARTGHGTGLLDRPSGGEETGNKVPCVLKWPLAEAARTGQETCPTGQEPRPAARSRVRPESGTLPQRDLSLLCAS